MSSSQARAKDAAPLDAARAQEPRAPHSGPVPIIERRRSRAERRHDQRLPLVVAVRQQVVPSAAPVPAAGAPALPRQSLLMLAQSSDLGLGGMRLWRRCSQDDPVLPIHTPLQLAFELPGEDDIVELRGEVVFDETPAQRQDFRATGVRFFELSDADRARLERFLAAQKDAQH